MRPQGSFEKFLFPGLVWAVGLLVAFHPMILSGFSRIQQDLGDTRLNNLFLEHGYRWITGVAGHERFFDPPYFFPATNVAAYSDNLLGSAPIYWLARWLGLEADSAFQAWLLGVSSLNYLAFLWLARSVLGLGAVGSVGGAFLFAFAAPRLAQVGHPQLFPQFFTILAVGALGRLLRGGGGSRRWIALFFASCVLQLYAAFYLGWYLAFGLAITAIWAMIRKSRRQWMMASARHLPWAFVGICAVLSVVAIAPLAFSYLSASREVGARSWEEVAWMLPRLQSWLFHGSWSWLYSWQQEVRMFQVIPVDHEQRLGVGLVTLWLSIHGLLLGRKTHSEFQLAWFIWGFVVLASTAFIFRDATLWFFVYSIFPGADAVRAVARIVLLALIPLSLGFAFSLDRVAAKKQALALGLLAFGILEQGQTTPAFDKTRARQRVQEVVALVNRDRCRSLFYSPILRPGETAPEFFVDDWLQVDAQWAAFNLGIPTVNGYSGKTPPGWNFRELLIRSPEDDARVEQNLRGWMESRNADYAGLCRVKRSFTEFGYD